MLAETQLKPAGQSSYDVSLPEAGLDWQRVGPLFERYSIKLLGTVDSSWIENYQRIVTKTPSLSRFRLDPSAGAVSFTCRSSDGPVEVMSVLRILEGFVERVNQECGIAATQTRPAPRSASAAVPIAAGKSR